MWKHVYVWLLAGVVIAGTVVAETPGVVKEKSRSDSKECDAASVQMMQQNMAGCMLLGNQEQVVMAQFASDRAQNPKVKQFAQMLEKNHNQMIAQLEKLAPGGISTEMLAKRSSLTRTEYQANKVIVSPETDAVDIPSGKTDKDSQQLVNFFATMRRQMAENCIALSQHELSDIDKDQFDKAYVSQQIYAHIGILAGLKTSKPYVTGELKTIVESEEKTARAHLDQAKNLWKELESKN